MATEQPLRVVFVSPYFDARAGGPTDALDRFSILAELPRQLRAHGHHVQVLGLAAKNASFARDGVNYRWIAASAPVRLAGRLMHRWKPHYGPAYYQPSLALASAIRRLRPDVVHVFGLTMDPQLALIGLLAHAGAHIVVHYHGGEPVRGPLRRRLQALALRRVAAVYFTAVAQAQPWLDAGLLGGAEVQQVLETSSPYTGFDREEARARTGMRGDPVYLSAGRLHPIKDPLTMLRGFAHIAREQPAARLYLYYLTDELLHDARATVHTFPHLRERVEFRGRARPQEMEAIYSSADILLQASLREWSGLAILEAMSCGCIPVVSDIPSFAAMLGHDGHGRLFEPGDAAGLARAALSIEDLAAMSAAVEQRFRDELSFVAIARDLDALYRGLLEPA